VYLVTGGLSSLSLTEFEHLSIQRRINLLTWIDAMEKKNAKYVEDIKAGNKP